MRNWSDFDLNRGASLESDRDITSGKSQEGPKTGNEESRQKLTSYHSRIIAGLGNPGRRYESTRHNAGFMLLDAFAAQHNPPKDKVSWTEHSDCLVTECFFASEKRILVKPQRFMNLSGEPIRALMDYYQIKVEELVVAHDDLDLSLGHIRLKRGGGDGGHNGIRSLVSCLDSKDFVRVKLGIGRPILVEGQERENLVTSWVLNPFSADDKPLVDAMLNRGVKALMEVCSSGLESAQRLYNER